MQQRRTSVADASTLDSTPPAGMGHSGHKVVHLIIMYRPCRVSDRGTNFVSPPPRESLAMSAPHPGVLRTPDEAFDGVRASGEYPFEPNYVHVDEHLRLHVRTSKISCALLVAA